MDEIKAIQERYKRRNTSEIATRYPAFSPFQHFSRSEREFWMGQFLTQVFGQCKEMTAFEIGAGTGDNLVFFRRFGLLATQIFANELLPERCVRLRDWLPEANLFAGDATLVRPERAFDIVFQSMVFSSILDQEFRRRLADHIWELTKPGGVVLSYEFEVNNPRNPDVRGLPWRELQGLFPKASRVLTHRVTLAPPLGRRVGRLYNFVNWPFLRTHRVSLFLKS